jgi:hypothetical protein
MTTNYNGNGKYKWIAGIAGTVIVLLLGWNFGEVVALQVSAGSQAQQVAALRVDLDFLRQSTTNFELETRTSIAASQTEMRQNVAHIADILTDLRIHLSDLSNGKAVKR